MAENASAACMSEAIEDGDGKSEIGGPSADKPRIARTLRETLAAGSGRPACRNSRLGQYDHRNAGAPS